MASTATKLFEGSHDQSFQNGTFTTAGRDIHCPTYNINLNASGLLASELPNSQIDPSAREQASWSSIFQQVHGFFRRAENRGALVHGETVVEGEYASPANDQHYTNNAPIEGGSEDDAASQDLSGESDSSGQSEDSSRQSLEDCCTLVRMHSPRSCVI
jgi:hypothetical protein